eukprot:9496259-Ditylum_brightwellii.AAC.1
MATATKPAPINIHPTTTAYQQPPHQQMPHPSQQQKHKNMLTECQQSAAEEQHSFSQNLPRMPFLVPPTAKTDSRIC